MKELDIKKLIDNKELYKKYLIAEQEYYKKIGNKYTTVEMEIDLDDEMMKKLFVSLAKTNICFDDYIVCLLKEEIVRKEIEKL